MTKVVVFGSNSPLRGFVVGYVYRCRMANGAGFEVWSPERLERKVAREALLAQANGDWFEEGEQAYEKRDITALWEARS